MAGGVIGRERELSAVASFFDDPDSPAILLIEGEPGIGKTTIWSAAVTAAIERGYRVVSARPLQVETTISFAAVGDLLEPILDQVRPELPDPQRRALEIALLLAEPEGPPPTPGVIAFALLSALRAAAEVGPLLVAVDDVQWLDRPSAAALLYVLRRVRNEPLRFVLARRIDQEAPALDLERAYADNPPQRLLLGPLSIGAIQRLLSERFGAVLSRPVLQRLHAESGGNPFYALEIARALQRQGGPVTPRDPLPVPETLAEIVRERLSALPRETEHALQVAALLSNPTVGVVAEITGEESVFVPAIDAHVIELDGERIAFSHPLLASGLATRIDPLALAGLHRRIADTTADPEERARHLALATEEPDDEAAAALEAAANRARSRGAPEVAAELLERALPLTPLERHDERRRRLLAGAEAQRDAGDWARARELADQAILLSQPGPERARALLALGRASAEPTEPCTRALAEAGRDLELRAQIGMYLAQGDFLTDFRLAMKDASTAAEDAEAAGDPSLVAQALALRAWFEGACAVGDPLATLERSASFEQQSTEPATGFTSTFNLATVRMWRDELEAARAGFSEELAVADHRGDAYRRMHALIHLAQVEWRAGAWAQAVDYAEAAQDVWGSSGDDQGVSAVLWTDAVIAVHRGELDQARAEVDKALSAGVDDRLHQARHAWVLGFAALSQDLVEEALRRLEPAARIFGELGVAEPGMRLFASDLIEAWVTVGNLEAAEAEADELLQLGQRLRRPRAAALGLRGKGLVLAERGDLDGAVATLRRSTALADSFPVPFEHARTLLALGTVERRGRHRREARESLEQALSLFEQLGAPLWAEKTRSELSRIGGRAPTRTDLTPAERRIAELVAQGKTNREVAAELVVSVHTVESALTHVYKKLGVRSRTEMARKLSQ